MRPLLLALFFPLLLEAKELETCYRVYFWSLPVAENCSLYVKEGARLKIRSWARTVVIGGIVKPVNSWGEANLLGLKPESFSLFQREGSYVRDHLYLFEDRGVRFRIIRYKSEGRTVKEGFFESSVYLFDPFSTSLLIYLDTPNLMGGTVPIFYDEKLQSVDYRTVGEEVVEVFGRTYRTWKVLILPHFETRGLLKPRGRWYVWVDKDTRIPVKLRVNFTIGDVNMYLKEVKGDERLLVEVKDEQAGVF